MRLMVLTAAVFPSRAEAERKLWIFLRSAHRADVPSNDLHLYGVGTPAFPGYRAIKLDMQLDYLKKSHNGYTHVLYSDGWDAFFTAPLEFIIRAYEDMGRPPILVSAYHGLGNVPEPDKDYPQCFDESIYCRYPQVGGHISEIDAIIPMFERMLKLARQINDDCFNWYDAWAEGWFRPMLDSDSRIFQVTDSYTEIQNGRLHNTLSGSYPALLHLCGGYTDQVTGKDAVMIPKARSLGVI